MNIIITLIMMVAVVIANMTTVTTFPDLGQVIMIVLASVHIIVITV